MPRLSNIIASLALLTSTAFSVPFYVHEECFCQTSRPELDSQYHNATLGACEQVAARIQLSRAAARRLPLSPEVWIHDNDMISLSENPPHTQPEDSNAPYTITSARRKSAFEAAMKSISELMSAEHARHQHSAQTLPSRRNPRASLVGEQELRRRGMPNPEEYEIVCRGLVVQPSHRSTDSRERVLYIGFRPIPVLFIFLAMVLACTTIVEWTVETWQSYTARIRLEGQERLMYADGANLPSSVLSRQLPREKTGEIDLEKRAEAQDS